MISVAQNVLSIYCVVLWGDFFFFFFLLCSIFCPAGFCCQLCLLLCAGCAFEAGSCGTALAMWVVTVTLWWRRATFPLLHCKIHFYRKIVKVLKCPSQGSSLTLSSKTALSWSSFYSVCVWFNKRRCSIKGSVSLSPQRLVFDVPVFHPLVDPASGELDVKRAFAKWRSVNSCMWWCKPARGSLSHPAVFPFRRNHNHIWQVLMYARRVFYKIDTASPLNPEAAVLYVTLLCHLRYIWKDSRGGRVGNLLI